MTNEEAIKGLESLAKNFSGYKPNEEMFEMAIAALKCVADIAKYLTDPDVTWRDISDDCITGIMMKHGFMK